jgi:hypothetical protein
MQRHPTWRKKKSLISGNQVVGRHGPAHHQKCRSDVFGVCVASRLVQIDFVADLLMVFRLFMSAAGLVVWFL